MPLHYQATALTASGDTTKTKIDTITVPKGARQLVGIIQYHCAAAALTTVENLTGIIQLESDDVKLQPMTIPLDVIAIVGTGAVAYVPPMRPIGMAIQAGADIDVYVTLDLAQTGALKSRVVFVWDME